MKTITKEYNKLCICGKGWNNGKKKSHLNSVYHILWVNQEYNRNKAQEHLKYIVESYILYKIILHKTQKTKSN